MEKTPIQKINKIGKAGHIICKIAKVLLIIAAVCVFLAGIFTFILPQNFLQVQTESKANITVDLGSVNVDLQGMSGAELDEFVAEHDIQADYEMGDETYSVEDIQVDGNQLLITAGSDVHSFNVLSLRLVMIFALIYMIAAYIGTHFLSDLCKAVSVCQTPFEAGVIKKMWRFAVALIPIVLVGGNMEGIIQIIMTGNGTVGFTLDLTAVVAILLLFALVSIFKYGAQLQQESDETL